MTPEWDQSSLVGAGKGTTASATCWKAPRCHLLPGGVSAGVELIRIQNSHSGSLLSFKFSLVLFLLFFGVVVVHYVLFKMRPFWVAAVRAELWPLHWIVSSLCSSHAGIDRIKFPKCRWQIINCPFKYLILGRGNVFSVLYFLIWPVFPFVQLPIFVSFFFFLKLTLSLVLLLLIEE